MPTHHGGRHEHGQNFLTDGAVIGRVIDLARRTDGPIVEIGPGAGALTEPLLRLGRPLTAVEIDRRHADRLRRTTPGATIVHGDFLHHRLPAEPHAVVGNLP
ncbi:rRNA adenine N-6-methyltransferase family protein, partial [Tsukamurella paurometabola]